MTRRNSMRNRQRGRARPRRGNSAPDGPIARPLALPSIGKDTHTFVRWADPGGITRAALDQGYVWSFKLEDVANHTEFTALFDQYCIKKVRLVFTQLVTTSTNIQIVLTSDYDNATAPASFADIGNRRHISRVFSPPYLQHEFTLVPRVRAEVAGPQLNEAAILPPGSWFDCAAPAIPHFGVIAWIIGYNTTTAATNLLNLRVEYTLGMRVSR
jgi:hypothetical protein